MPERVLIDIQEVAPYMMAGRSLNGAIVDAAALSAGQQLTQRVQLLTPFADTNYRAVAVLVGTATLLGQLSVQSVSVVDEQNVDVVLKNNALITVSTGKLLVLAGHN